jgi:hypothetical protein
MAEKIGEEIAKIEKRLIDDIEPYDRTREEEIQLLTTKILVIIAKQNESMIELFMKVNHINFI